MNQSPVFEWVAEELGASTRLSRNEARGTLRLALDRVALSPNAVMRKPMGFVLKRVLPELLESRHVVDAQRLCNAIAERLENADLPAFVPDHDDPEDVFARLGGDDE